MINIRNRRAHRCEIKSIRAVSIGIKIEHVIDPNAIRDSIQVHNQVDGITPTSNRTINIIHRLVTLLIKSGLYSNFPFATTEWKLSLVHNNSRLSMRKKMSPFLQAEALQPRENRCQIGSWNGRFTKSAVEQT